MPLIPFPNVPALAAGVPPVPRSPNFPPTAGLVLSTVQGAIWRSFAISDQWGIFDKDGKRLGEVSPFTGALSLLSSISGASLSTNSMGYSKETRISDYPVEQGGFATYNKVEMPSQPSVTLIVSGTDDDRSKFLSSIDKATRSIDLYTVVTPEITYIDHAIERYNYERRSDNGAYMLIVQIFLKEIRQVSSLYLIIKSPKNPQSAQQNRNGKVQANEASSSVNSKINTPGIL
jgi:hypothetical protein